MKKRKKKMDEVFNMSSNVFFDDMKSIVGRDLTDEEKKKMGGSLKAYFLITTLILNWT